MHHFRAEISATIYEEGYHNYLMQLSAGLVASTFFLNNPLTFI